MGLAVVIAALTSGCARHIDMAVVAPTPHAHATVLYTGVRDAGRRYADYGVIDRSVLENAENH